jgi:hypothetical protein
MWSDPIVEEVRKVREEHAARFDYDLEKIFQDLKEQERQSGRKVVSLPPKRPVEVAAERSKE